MGVKQYFIVSQKYLFGQKVYFETKSNLLPFCYMVVFFQIYT